MRKLVLWACWLPPAAWLLGSWYVERFEGWGQWAAAPVLLPGLFLSLALGILGAGPLVRHRRRGKDWDWPLSAATVLASSVVLYVLARNLLA